jgi:hypothetical protein
VKVVGLTGYAGVGKNSVADILVRDYGYIQLAFADPLKEMIRDLNPILGFIDRGACGCEDCKGRDIQPVHLQDLYDYDYIDQDIKEMAEFGEELRRLWTTFGTEVMRKRQPDYWIRHMMTEILSENDDAKIVVTDVRYQNEAEFLNRLNAGDMLDSRLWRIARPGFEPGEHSSEQLAGLLGEEITLINDGTLEELAEIVGIAEGLPREGA